MLFSARYNTKTLTGPPRRAAVFYGSKVAPENHGVEA
jgi:hypothetical protein